MKYILLLAILCSCAAYSIFGSYSVEVSTSVYQGCHATEHDTWSFAENQDEATFYLGQFQGENNTYIVGDLLDNQTIEGHLVSNNRSYGKVFLLFGEDSVQGTITVDDCSYYVRGSK